MTAIVTASIWLLFVPDVAAGPLPCLPFRLTAAGQLPCLAVAPWVVAAGQLPHPLVAPWVVAVGQLSHSLVALSWVETAGQLPVLQLYLGLRPLASFPIPFHCGLRPLASFPIPLHCGLRPLASFQSPCCALLGCGHWPASYPPVALSWVVAAGRLSPCHCSFCGHCSPGQVYS